MVEETAAEGPRKEQATGTVIFGRSWSAVMFTNKAAMFYKFHCSPGIHRVTVLNYFLA